MWLWMHACGVQIEEACTRVCSTTRATLIHACACCSITSVCHTSITHNDVFTPTRNCSLHRQYHCQRHRSERAKQALGLRAAKKKQSAQMQIHLPVVIFRPTAAWPLWKTPRIPAPLLPPALLQETLMIRLLWHCQSKWQHQVGRVHDAYNQDDSKMQSLQESCRLGLDVCVIMQQQY